MSSFIEGNPLPICLLSSLVPAFTIPILHGITEQGWSHADIDQIVVDVNERTKEGKTALHYCGQTPGHVVNIISYQKVIYKMAERFINAVADVNAQDGRGETPLHQCALGFNVQC